jgi:hypothetical protein
MNSNEEPKLAPPGAGLPTVELLVARSLFAFKRWTGTRESFNTAFDQERLRVRELMAACDPHSAAERVLIDRPRGLEDSSRFWSVWMTLDHLRIVHRSVTHIIGALAKGTIPKGKASTASVKPDPQVTAGVVVEHEKSCDELMSTVASVADLQTPARYAHPWFGPLNAAGWHALSATHFRIHRVQLERILSALKSKPRAASLQRVMSEP